MKQPTCYCSSHSPDCTVPSLFPRLHKWSNLHHPSSPLTQLSPGCTPETTDTLLQFPLTWLCSFSLLFQRLHSWSSQHNTPVPTLLTAVPSLFPRLHSWRNWHSTPVPTHLTVHLPSLFPRLRPWSSQHNTPVPTHMTAQLLLLFCSKGCTREATNTHQFPLTRLRSCFSFVPKAALLEQPTHTSPLTWLHSCSSLFPRLPSWRTDTAAVPTYLTAQFLLSLPLWLDSCSRSQTPLQIALTRDCVEGFLCSLSPGLASWSSWHTSLGLFPVFCTVPPEYIIT